MSQRSYFQEFIKDIEDITEAKVSQWCNIIEKMGKTDKTVQWNNIFKKQVVELYDDMITEATERQDQLLTNIEMLLKRSESLCKDLHIKMPIYGSEHLSLYEEEEFLQSRIKEYEQMLEVKLKEITALNNEQKQLCQTLGREPVSIPLSPLPTAEFISDFKHYLESLESEKFEREEKFLQIKSAIVDIINELKFKPTLDFEKLVISADDSLFAVTDTNMKKLENFYQSLQQQHCDTKDEITTLREKIKHLWEILSEDLQTCDAFLQKHTGINLDTLEALKQEAKRCEGLKKANIEVFVKHLRDELVSLWDQCHLTDEERTDFEYFHTSLYTEDLLSLHDIEIQKLKKYYLANSELFNLLDKRNELWSKMLELEQRASAPNRYKNRGGQLLKEEKERNALSKRIPKIEDQLMELAREYENRVGKPFTSWGKTIEAIIGEAYQSLDENKKLKLSGRKNRDRTNTPAKSMLGMTLCTSTQNLVQLTPSVYSSKRKIATPLFPSKRTKVLGNHNDNAPHTAPSKLVVNGHPTGRSRYSIERAKRIEKCRRMSQRMMQKCLGKENSGSSEYDEFKENLGSKQGCRSTLFVDSGDLQSTLAMPLLSTPVRPAMSNTPRRTPGINSNRSRSPRILAKLSTAPNLKLLF